MTPETDLQPIIPALAGVFENALGATVAELNLKSITDEFSALMYEYPFRVPAYYALIIRSLVTLDGIAISVDPNFKVLSKAYPYVAKRLLTDPAPELRSSLQALLFKDGSFRWNRLENLLRNASDSEDYDLPLVLNQATEFLFSERGSYIRNRVADELAKELDNLGYGLFDRFRGALRSQLGLVESVAPTQTSAAGSTSSWQQLIRILTILRETRGFDVRTLAAVLPKLIIRPETQAMGRRVVNGVLQRTAARLIREVLMPSTLPPASTTVLNPAQVTSRQRQLASAGR